MQGACRGKPKAESKVVEIGALEAYEEVHEEFDESRRNHHRAVCRIGRVGCDLWRTTVGAKGRTTIPTKKTPQASVSVPPKPVTAEDKKRQEEQQKLQEKERELAADFAFAREARKNPAKNLTITKWEWSLGGLGTVMQANFTIENKNPFRVKDLKFKCQTMGGSDTVLSTPTYTLYEEIPPNTSKRFTMVNMGFVNSQSKRANCEIVHADAY